MGNSKAKRTLRGLSPTVFSTAIGVVREEDGKPAIYLLKKEAQQDATAFNSMRKKGDEPYQVKEYKK